jgi:phage repressor protein C with HTH and peptisase S24 domain
MSTGSRIKTRREACGLSVDELAARLGKNRTTVYRYESDEIENLPAKMLGPLATILETTPAYLMGWTDDYYDYDADPDNRLATIPSAMFEEWQEQGLEPSEIWRRYLEVEQSGQDGRLSPQKRLSDDAIKLARLYDTLDNYGQDAVREVAQVEKARCEDEERFLQETELEPEPKVIPDYTFAAAAGPLLGVAGQESVPYTLQPDDPQGAVYAVHVSGDSMAPWFPDGSRVFVNMDQVRDGDIGVFCVNGATVIKQYHFDAVMGITYLFSLNRKRNDADVVITPYSGISLFCQGRVITKRHFPVPM